MRSRIIFIFIGLAIGNFLFPLLDGNYNFSDAIERTFFQFIALAGVFITTYLKD